MVYLRRSGEENGLNVCMERLRIALTVSTGGY